MNDSVDDFLEMRGYTFKTAPKELLWAFIIKDIVPAQGWSEKPRRKTRTRSKYAN